MNRGFVLSPNDESVVGEVDWLNASELQVRLEQFFKKKVSEKAQRARALKMVADHIQATSEDWAQLIASEGGKPLRDARVEVARAVVTLELCAEEAVSCREEILPMQRTARPAARRQSSIRNRWGRFWRSPPLIIRSIWWRTRWGQPLPPDVPFF
ncbi:MAG: aldehyde dehydrogenase family protein [Bdellovibrionales bacterium]|nr:aldehyde dehydrogenase family protein [Bdellovibrionales bacterium]